MEHKLTTIDIFGSNNKTLESQTNIIKEIPYLSVKKHVCSNFSDYLYKQPNLADILIINLTDQALTELKSLESSDFIGKSIVAIGNKNENNLLSLAISVGVNEFINESDYQLELLKTINKIILNRTVGFKTFRKRTQNVFINSKGGSGASFITSNVAYLLAKNSSSNVVLLDMDLQFGSIGLNFDLVPKYTLVEVLSSINDIDPVGLEAYLLTFNNSLKLMLPSPDDIVLPGEIKPESVKSLMYALQRNYNQILIDLPRIIDPLAIAVLEQADHISIVVQQSLAQYRDGRRLINILNKELDIPLEQINVVINRYDPKNSLKKTDMIDLVKHNNVFTIANDYKRAVSASNLGEPVCYSAPKSKIARDMEKLAMFLGEEIPKKQSSGLMGGLKSWFGN